MSLDGRTLRVGLSALRPSGCRGPEPNVSRKDREAHGLWHAEGVRGLTRRIAASVMVVALAGASVAAQPALAQGDTQPPRVSSFSPPAGGAGVSVTVTVTAAF